MIMRITAMLVMFITMGEKKLETSSVVNGDATVSINSSIQYPTPRRTMFSSTGKNALVLEKKI